VDERQAVGHEAAAHDQHALVAQGRKPLADLEQMRRLQIRHRDLEDWDVGIGIHRNERHVRAVVQATVRPLRHLLAGRHQGFDLRGQIGGAGES